MTRGPSSLRGGLALALVILLSTPVACGRLPSTAESVVETAPAEPSSSPTRPARAQVAADEHELEGRQEASCFADPVAFTDHRLAPKPLTPFARTQLEALLEITDGHCVLLNSPQSMVDSPKFTAPTPLDEVSCLYDAARVHFEHNQWTDAARLFRRVWEEFPTRELSIYAAQLYLECLHILASKTGPPRPACYEVMERDVERIACQHCQPGHEHVEACDLLRRIRFELPFRDRPSRLSSEDDPACPRGERWLLGRCRPLPALTPARCP